MRRALALITCVMVAGCASPPAVTPSSTAAQPSNAAVPPPATANPPPPPVTDLHADFATLSARIPAEVGVAVVSGPTVSTFGTWTTGTAWSTIKVPLAIAALRADPTQAEGFVPAAISQSDNAAAERLWSLLGESNEAAAAVETVLKESGDPSTAVQPDRVRPGFTAFGQTDWPTEAQARFAWRLPCIAGSEPVLSDMHHIAAGQVWGLVDNAEVAAKSGWGPGERGGYLVRQLATVAVPAGDIGVALAAEPTDGTFESGVAAINQLADWVNAHRAAFVAVPCR
jgi:hypothetical protein